MKQRKTLYEHIDSATFNLLGSAVSAMPLLRASNTATLILCYHSISNSGWRFSTKPAHFEKQIKYLTKHFAVIGLRDALEGKPGISITFDDGYKDVFTVAYPILKKYGLTATVFVLGNTQQVNRETLQNKLSFMTSRQIQTLHKNGWEIGYHTNSHQNLCSIDHATAFQEIVSSKKAAEKSLGFKLKYFAYPLGMYNAEIIKLVSKAGFVAAFTINGGVVHTNTTFEVPRVALEGSISHKYFIGLLTTVGLMINQLFIRTLQLKEQLRLSLIHTVPAIK